VGSVWLAEMIKANCDVPVVHEPFHQGNSSWGVGFARWMDLGPSAVMVSHYAREYIPEIQEACAPVWAMLWRHPFDLIKSHVVREAFNCQFPSSATIGTRMRVG